MRIEVLAPEQLPAAAAEAIAGSLRVAIAARGRATFAVSGGSTPGVMLTELAGHDEVDWTRVDLLQVDERVAPDGHEDRNLELLRRRFLAHRGVPAERVHALPVSAADLDAAAAGYADRLRHLAGDPPELDVVQLGLGADGHTASLVPADPVLDAVDREVAVTDRYAGRRRLTLTVPPLRRARERVWLVSGADKAAAVAGLVAGDPRLPAAAVRRDHDLLLVDIDAADRLPGEVVHGSPPATDPTSAASTQSRSIRHRTTTTIPRPDEEPPA